MSWRSGLDMYLDFLDVIDKYELDEDSRLDLKARILDVFFYHDVDSSGMEEDPVLAPIYARLEQIHGR
jgi:hypothetical protein